MKTRLPPLAFILLLAACAHWTVVDYQARPAAAEHLTGDFERLVLVANHAPTKVELHDGYAQLLYVAPNGFLSTNMLTFSEVSKLELKSKGVYFAVELYDRKGESLAWFEYESVERAHQMFDVLAALTQAPNAGKPPTSL